MKKYILTIVSLLFLMSPLITLASTATVFLKNTKESYSLMYPTTWYRTDGHLVDLGNVEDIFQINNYPLTDIQKPAFDLSKETTISVTVSLVSKNDNFKTIDDLIVKSAQDYPKEQQAAIIKTRLAGVQTVKIGKQKVRVWHIVSKYDETYTFIYKNKQYTVKGESPNSDEFAKDEPVFSAVFKSLVLNGTDHQLLAVKDTSADTSSCLPTGVSKDTIVSIATGGKNKVTVGQKLTVLKASCLNKQLVDGNKKPITFYNLIGCWGTPPPDYRQSLNNQDAAIKKLQTKYTVITLTCNPSGVLFP